MLRKNPSESNIMPGLIGELEETKGFANSVSSFKEEPPKDNNERVERLLTKLENASLMDNI